MPSPTLLLIDLLSADSLYQSLITRAVKVGAVDVACDLMEGSWHIRKSIELLRDRVTERIAKATTEEEKLSRDLPPIATLFDPN